MLDLATAAFDRGDLPATLAALLDAWRVRPDTELAELIEELGARLPGPPITGKTLALQDAEFARRLAARDPRDLPILVAHALGRRQSALVPGRLIAELATWPCDPRTTRPLIAALASPTWDSATAHGVWDGIFALLRHTADPRAVAALAELDFAAIWARRMFGEPHVRAIRGMEKRREKLAIAAAPPGSPTEVSAIAALATQLRAPRSHEALIEAVLEHPDRLSARDVLRDALLEAGDPRGEHMALDALARTRSLTPAERLRRRELVRDARWWPELAEVAAWPDVRDGFLVACTLVSETAHLIPAVIGHPRWSTVERIGLAYWTLPPPIALLAHPTMRALSALGGFGMHHAPTLWTPETTWLWTVEIQHLTRDWAALMQRADAVPALRRIESSQYYDKIEDYAWLWPTPVFGRLREFAVHLGRDSLGRWQAAVSGEAHAHLARIELGRYRLERDAGGRLAQLTVTLPDTPRETPHTKTIATSLAGLADRTIARVRFVGRAIDRKQRGVLEAALANQSLEELAAEAV